MLINDRSRVYVSDVVWLFLEENNEAVVLFYLGFQKKKTMVALVKEQIFIIKHLKRLSKFEKNIRIFFIFEFGERYTSQWRL